MELIKRFFLPRKWIKLQCNPKESRRDLDGWVGGELERADDEEEHPHDVLIAPEEGGRRMADLGLDLERGDGGREAELDEGERERHEGEDNEEEDDVMVVKEVVGDPSGVAEPDGLGEGQTPPQRRLHLPQRRVRQHLRQRKNQLERERRTQTEMGMRIRIVGKG